MKYALRIQVIKNEGENKPVREVYLCESDTDKNLKRSADLLARFYRLVHQ